MCLFLGHLIARQSSFLMGKQVKSQALLNWKSSLKIQCKESPRLTQDPLYQSLQPSLVFDTAISLLSLQTHKDCQEMNEHTIPRQWLVKNLQGFPPWHSKQKGSQPSKGLGMCSWARVPCKLINWRRTLFWASWDTPIKSSTRFSVEMDERRVLHLPRYQVWSSEN